MTHATLPPSSASVWGFCSGSVAVAQAAPDIETEDSRNGDAAHWVCSESLLAWKNGAPHEPHNWVGAVAPNGVVITEDHTEGAAVYVDDVVTTLSALAGGREALQVECRVHMPAVHPTLNWGTFDAGAFVGRTIYMWDYKHGHSPVEAVGNLQLVDYLEGVREALGINGAQDQHTLIDARIVQPNAFDGRGPVRHWAGRLSDIRPLVNQLHQQAEESQTNPQLVAGLHCVHCPGRIKCTALRRSNYRSIDMVKMPFLLEDLTGRELATEKAILERGLTMIKKRIDAIDEDLLHRIKRGEGGTGLSIGTSRGKVVWTVGPEQAIAALSLCGVDIRKPHCDTPAQARMKVSAPLRDTYDSMVTSITKRNSSTKLVSSEDTLAAKVFSKK